MNKKKRALALGLATTQLAALSAIVAPVAAFADEIAPVSETTALPYKVTYGTASDAINQTTGTANADGTFTIAVDSMNTPASTTYYFSITASEGYKFSSNADGNSFTATFDGTTATINNGTFSSNTWTGNIAITPDASASKNIVIAPTAGSLLQIVKASANEAETTKLGTITGKDATAIQDNAKAKVNALSDKLTLITFDKAVTSGEYSVTNVAATAVTDESDTTIIKSVDVVLTVTTTSTTQTFVDNTNAASTTQDVTINLPAKVVAEGVLATDITGVTDTTNSTGASATVKVKKVDEANPDGVEVNVNDKIYEGDVLKIEVSLTGGSKPATWKSGAPTVTLGNAAQTAGETSFTYTVTKEDIKTVSGTDKFTVTVAGDIVQDTTPYKVKLPAFDTGYVVTASYTPDGGSLTDINSETTEIPVGSTITIKVAPTDGYVLDATSMKYDGAGMTDVGDGTHTATYKISGGDADKTTKVIDLSSKLTGVKALREITPTLTPTTTPVDLSTGANALTLAEYTTQQSGGTLTQAIKDAITGGITVSAKDTAASAAAINLNADDYTLTVGAPKAGTSGKPDTVEVTFALTNTTDYKLDSASTTNGVKVDVPVKFAVEYTVSVDAISNANVTLAPVNGKGKVGDTVTITIAPSAATHVIKDAPTLKGNAFTDTDGDGTWEYEYVIAAEDATVNTQNIELTITATVLEKQPTPALSPKYTTNKFETATSGTTYVFHENKDLSDTGVEVTAAGTDIDIPQDYIGTDKTLYVVAKGDAASNKADSDKQTIPLKKQAAPTTVSASKISGGSATLSGVTTAMKFSTDGTTYTACSSTSETISSATERQKIYVIYAEDDTNGFASDPVEITLSADTVLNVEASVTAPASAGTYNGSPQSLTATVTITNAGANDTATGTIEVDDTDFTLSSSSLSVAAGGNQDVTVTCAKTNAGSYTATLTITVGTDPDTTTVTVPVEFTINKAAGDTLSAPAATFDDTTNKIKVDSPVVGLQYALSTDNTTAPTTFGTATEFDVTTSGDYYVWATKPADNNHEASTPVCSVAVNVAITAPVVTEYSVAVTKTGTGNGTVTVTPSAAKIASGTSVKVTAAPDSKSTVGAITVTDAAGNAVPCTNGTFTMPSSNVTITVTFNKKSTSSGGSSGGSGGTRRPSGSTSSSSGSKAPGMSDSEVSAIVNTATSGGTAKIDGNILIPTNIIKTATDKKVNLEVKVDDSFTWNIDTNALTDTSSALRLSVTKVKADETRTAKIEKSAGVSDRTDVSFTTVAKNLGTGAKLTVKTLARPTAAVPQFANLYKTKPDGTLEFVAVAPVDKDGNAVLPIETAGQYTVVTSNETKKPGDIDNDCTVDLTDLMSALKLYLNSKDHSRAANFKLDYDGSGTCQLSDISVMLKDFTNGKLK